MGTRSGVAHLPAREAALAGTLRAARHFGGRQSLPDAENVAWQVNWNLVETIANRTRVRVKKLAAGRESNEADNVERATAV
jgi:hypothetical protein